MLQIFAKRCPQGRTAERPFCRLRDIDDANDAAQARVDWRAHAETMIDLVAGYVVGALRCVNENSAAVSRRPGPLLNVLNPDCDQGGPRLADG
jgi:hypothetical protein